MTANPEPPSSIPLRRVSFLRTAWELIAARGNVFRFADNLRRKFGKSIFLPFALPAYVMSDPRDLRHIFIANPDNYHKLGALVIARSFLGEGLVTSDGAFHHRQRRAMQPMFHRQKIQNFAAIMRDCTQKRMADWREGEPLQIVHEMMRVTLSTISQSLFSVDLDKDSTELSRAVINAQRYIVSEIKIPLTIPFLSASRKRRYQEAVDDLDRALAAVVQPRCQPDSPPKDDMLQMLLDIRFEDGGKMSTKELRDELITLFVAGHETTASSLAWTLYLLTSNPRVEAKLCEEIDRVLTGRLPGIEDIPQLRYTEMVMWESMRLRPPVWLMGRLILKDDDLPSGTRLQAGAQVLIVNYAAHRDPVFFPDPEKFIPERFETKTGITQGFLPFGAGIRSCVGEPYAKMEIIITLAMIYRKYRFKLHGKATPEGELLILYRPKDGVPLVPVLRENVPVA